MKRKYKILHLVESLEAIGGLEKIAVEIVSHLNKDEFEAEIWCVDQGGIWVDELRRQGIVVKVLGISTYYNPFNILRLAKLFREAKADIIHTHIYYVATIGRIAGKIAGINVLINHVHSTYWHYRWRNLLVERVLSRITYQIICVSNSVRNFVIHHEKINSYKIRVIHNGISFHPNSSRQQFRQTNRVAESDVIVTMVANLHENKGHKVLLDALNLMGKKYPSIQCWIVGQGPMEKELKEYVQQLGLDRVTFWGVRHDIPQILSATDIFVLASIEREGLALAVIEAMASERAVIVTDVGGLPELIDDQRNGLIVPPKDALKLSQAIEDLVIHESKRHQLAKEALKKFKNHFQVDTMMMSIEKLYKEALNP